MHAIKGTPELTAVHSPFARKLGTFVALSDNEMSALERLHSRRRVFPAGRDMVH